MDLIVFESLKEMFADSVELSVIVDADWNIQWSNRPCELTCLREKLMLSKDHWENALCPFLHEQILYNCRICCYKRGNLRLLQFAPAIGENFSISLLTSIIQNMLAGVNGLHNLLDDGETDEERDYLNSQAGNILRLYRVLFLQKQTERGLTNAWDAYTLDLRQAAFDVSERLKNLFRSFADVTFRCDEEKIYVRGDLIPLQCAISAAYLLCVREPENHQKVVIDLIRDNTAGYALLHITVNALKRERKDLKEQLQDFGPLSAERLLLDQYCRVFGCSAMFANREKSVSCTFRIPLADEFHYLTFSTKKEFQKEVQADTYFLPTDVMLARIRFRKYF